MTTAAAPPAADTAAEPTVAVKSLDTTTPEMNDYQVISEDGQLQKRVLREGTGPCPPKGSKVAGRFALVVVVVGRGRGSLSSQP